MTTICVPKESALGEKRVALTPEVCKKLITAGHTVRVETGAGAHAGFHDQEYQAAGAHVANDITACTSNAHIMCVVTPPVPALLDKLPDALTIIGLFGKNHTYYQATQSAVQPQTVDLETRFSQKGISGFGMTLLPRISRAQSMDMLSSQSTIAGYWAALEVAHQLNILCPLLMTAAGTLTPARVLILGAGVAGLQALATLRRLGATVHVSDIRPAAQEQVESLGGQFLAPPTTNQTQDKSGYAKTLSTAEQSAQQQQLCQVLPKMDAVITTALVPGKPAPTLLTQDMATHLRPGSVVIDLAAVMGGNCAHTRPGLTHTHQGVTYVGELNPASHYPQAASGLYAKNMLHALNTLFEDVSGFLTPQPNEELTQATHIGAPLAVPPSTASRAAAAGA